MTMPNPMGTYAGVRAGKANQNFYLTITAANSSTGEIKADYHDGIRANPLIGKYSFANAEHGGQASFELSSAPGSAANYAFSLVSNAVTVSQPFDTLSGNYWLNGGSHRIDLKKTY